MWTNCSEFFSGCTMETSLKASASGSRTCGASFTGTADAPGLKARWMAAQPFISRCQKNKQGGTMTKQRWILLAEDNAKDADLTMRALSANQSPSEVVLANDGAEALDCLYRRGAFQARDDDPPAVVLLDLKMPKVDGLEVLRQIKNDVVLKNIPVVIFTSSRERIDLARTYQLGANAYVVKPLGFQEFVSALKDVKKFWLIINEPPPVELIKFADMPVQQSKPQLADAA